MIGVSIEATLELRASLLRDAKAQIAPLFTQARVVVSAGLFLNGLLGPERPYRAVCAMPGGRAPHRAHGAMGGRPGTVASAGRPGPRPVER